MQVMSVLEGSSNKRQRAWAWADPPHIVIGNPENLSKLVATGAIRVNAVSYVVVDEVDACLLSEATRSWLHELLARSLSPTHSDDDEGENEEEAARLIAAGAGRVTGAAAPVMRRVKDRQTVFASATVPQHNHFVRQCVQVLAGPVSWLNMSIVSRRLGIVGWALRFVARGSLRSSAFCVSCWRVSCLRRDVFFIRFAGESRSVGLLHHPTIYMKYHYSLQLDS